MGDGLPTAGGLKRLSNFLAGQLKTAVDITGGAISGITLGLASSRTGTFTLNGATPVVVAKAGVSANSVIVITLKTVGGTVGAVPAIQTITAGTGFNVAGTAGDTSVYNYAIIG
jgi:hypothetical protein